MNKAFIKFIVMALWISACSQNEPTPPTISQDQILDTAVAGVIQTQTAGAPSPAPSETPLPAAQPATETSASAGQEYAWNYIATQESGGVVITIARLVVGERDAVGIDFSSLTIFDDKPVVAEGIFIVENKTASIISVYPDQGKALTGSEQVEFFDYAIAGANAGDSQYSGDFLPGAKLIGGLWFGFQRTSLTDINSMTIFISSPFETNSLTNLGPDYNFVLDLSQKQYVELPEELK